MSGRRLPFGMIFSSSRGEKPINFSTLGVGAHSRSIRNRVVRHVFNDPSLNYKIPDIPCKPITGLELLIDVSGTLQLSEDYASDTFTVRLNKAPLSDTKVSLVVNDTTEAEVSVSEITFTPENFYKPVTVTVTGKDDPLVDGTISTFVSVSLVGEDEEKIKFVYVENQDNESSDWLTISGINNLRIDGDEGVQSQQTVDFEMSFQPAEPTNFDIVSNTANVVLSRNTLTFDSNTWSTRQSVTFTLNKPDDNIAGGDITEDVVITYINQDTGNIDYTKTINIVFADDDILESNIDSGEGLLYEDSSLTVDISLNKVPVSDVNLSVFSANIGRLSVAPANLTFTTANYATPQTVTLTGIDNEILDAPGTVDISLTFVGGGNDNITYTSQKKFTVDLYDSIKNILTEFSSVTMDEGSSLDFDISLSTRPVQDIRVTLLSSTNQLKPISDLSFTSANWNTPQTITLEANLSNFATDQTDTLQISGEAGFNGINIPIVVSNIYHTIDILLSDAAIDVNEGSNNTFDLSLGSQPTDSVTLSFTFSAAGYSLTDLSFTSLSDVTLATTDWNTNTSINVAYPDVDRFYNDISVNISIDSTSNDSDYNITQSLLVNLYNTDVPLTDLSRNISVAVADDGNGNKFYIDDDNDTTVEYAPTLTLHQGSAYKFSQDDGSNATHQLQISETDNGTHNGGTEYTLGTKYKGTANSPEFTEFVVPIDNTLDKLYYYCVNHSGMGGNVLLARDYNNGAGFYFNVTVASGVFNINGLAQETVVLTPGITYYFDQSDSSNYVDASNNHPIKFAETTDGTALSTEAGKWTIGDNAGTAGTDLITSIEIDATYASANIFYACQNHSGMGGSIKYLR